MSALRRCSKVFFTLAWLTIKTYCSLRFIALAQLPNIVRDNVYIQVYTALSVYASVCPNSCVPLENTREEGRVRSECTFVKEIRQDAMNRPVQGDPANDARIMREKEAQRRVFAKNRQRSELQARVNYYAKS